MKFKHKSVVCEPENVWDICDEYRDKWIVALLTRMHVDSGKIDRALNDPYYSKRAWRDELFFEHAMEIIKHPDKVVIKRYQDNDENLILGEWKNPEIVRVNDGNRKYCEVRLNYWQLV